MCSDMELLEYYFILAANVGYYCGDIICSSFINDNQRNESGVV